MQWLVFVWIGIFSYLIIDWMFNQQGSAIIIEGLANDNTNTKCPEDCTSVKELQTKLSESLKNVAAIESRIAKNTTDSALHSKSIADMNQAIVDMQKDQKDE